MKLWMGTNYFFTETTSRQFIRYRIPAARPGTHYRGSGAMQPQTVKQ